MYTVLTSLNLKVKATTGPRAIKLLNQN